MNHIIIHSHRGIFLQHLIIISRINTFTNHNGVIDHLHGSAHRKKPIGCEAVLIGRRYDDKLVIRKASRSLQVGPGLFDKSPNNPSLIGPQ